MDVRSNKGDWMRGAPGYAGSPIISNQLISLPTTNGTRIRSDQVAANPQFSGHRKYGSYLRRQDLNSFGQQGRTIRFITPEGGKLYKR
jgi:hypothetical protein